MDAGTAVEALTAALGLISVMLSVAVEYRRVRCRPGGCARTGECRPDCGQGDPDRRDGDGR
jgi:hypothetical protein